MSKQIPSARIIARMCVDVCEGICADERSEESVVKELTEELTDWRRDIGRRCAEAYYKWCLGSGHSYFPACANRIEAVGKEESDEIRTNQER